MFWSVPPFVEVLPQLWRTVSQIAISVRAFPEDQVGIDRIVAAHGMAGSGLDAQGQPVGPFPPGTTVVTGADGSETERRNPADLAVFEAPIDTGGVATHAFIEVFHPAATTSRSHGHLVELVDGVASVSVPPAATGALVRITAYADGYLPQVVAEFGADEFWELAVAPDQRVLAYEVAMQPGEVFPDGGDDGLPRWLLAAGLALAGVVALGVGLAIALVVRRRRA